MLRLINIKMPIEHNIEDLKIKITKLYNFKLNSFKSFKISKKSIDARNKNNIFITYSVDISVDNEEKYLNKKNVSKIIENKYLVKKIYDSKTRPVVVGSGPAGLFCALILAENGLNPIILERGKNVLERKKDVDNFFKTGVLNEDSNVQFGEGGAGTFSDGKLTTGIKDVRIYKVIKEFIDAGAPEEIAYLSKPHIGTDKLIHVLINIRKKIESLGGEFRFLNKLTDIIVKENKIVSTIVKDYGNKLYELETKYLVLALGHSARDTFDVLKSHNMDIKRKSFAVGMRIEHSQKNINKAQYGKFYNKLGAADYKLNSRTENGYGVYTFCMCPGGYVVAATSQKEHLVTNGMSNYKRDGENANSALLVGINANDFKTDDIFEGIKFQTELEKKAFILGGKDYKAPVQLLGDFLADRGSKEIGDIYPTYKPGFALTDLRECFDSKLVLAFKYAVLDLDKKLNGFNSYDAVLTGVESRSSSPITLVRDSGMQSSIEGIYPCGEGSGYAGGIMSAAVDGIKSAEAIFTKMNV